jgi:signal peptidase
LAKSVIPKGIVKDIIIVGVGVLVIAFGLQVVFGTGNPFYVVASGSMIPVLEIYDVLVVQGDCFDLGGILDYEDCIRFSWYTPFEDIEIGDIIVFDRPSDHNRVIVHRVVSIIEDNPKTIRTQGDANPGSIPGTDFPITEEEYIGKVAHTLPQVGYITQLLKPPVNYVIIAIVIGIMIVKQFTKKKDKKGLEFTNPLDSEDPETIEELEDIDKIAKDSEYSKHVEETSDVEKSQDVKDEEDKSESSEESTENKKTDEKKD